jgi:dienelactone hydrolase
VLCVNGGSGGDVPGTWSATVEWLVERVAPRFPGLTFGEVKYKLKNWNRLGQCVADTRAALDHVDPTRCLLLGFSMGGAVAILSADDPRVEGVLGLAPWIPERLDLAPLEGKRLDVLHGQLDRYLPGVPGVSPTNSRRGFERARRQGSAGEYELIPGALHGLALRSPWGGLVRLPRAGRWAELVERRLEAFQASAG